MREMGGLSHRHPPAALARLAALALGLALLSTPGARAQSRVHVLRDGAGPTDIDEVLALPSGGLLVLGEGTAGIW